MTGVTPIASSQAGIIGITLKEMPQRTRRSKVKISTPKKKKTPFADSGAIVGTKVGRMFNLPWASGVGKWLGSGIGQIFGSGDYQLAGPSPEYNVLTSSKQIPKFSTSSSTNIICHREYLGDIMGTTAFTNRVYPLNPGINETFPWLSTIAENYQEYRFHGLVFEFRPMITEFVTGGAPGTVVMATNYNADAPNYSTKQQMENSEFAVSVKPTLSLMHGVECAAKQSVLSSRYVRAGEVAVGQDLRLYDAGNFQFATTNNPLQNLGELWVSYCVEFFKPTLPKTVNGTIESQHLFRTGSLTGNPFGISTTFSYGNLQNFTITPTIVSFTASVNAYYMLTITGVAGTGATLSQPAVAYTNCVGVLFFADFNSSSNMTPNTGTVSDEWSYSTVFQSTGTSETNVSVALAGGTLPISSVDIVVTQMDASLFP